MSNGTNPPKKRGCLFYGCLSLIIVGLAVATMLTIGYFIAKKKLMALVDDYTDPAPQAIETVTYPPPERDALQARLTAFKDAIDKNKAGEELVLTATDLNVLIGENAELKGKLFITLEDDQVKAKVAMPLDPIADALGFAKLKGRYLNGSGALRVALEAGQLDVRVESIQVRNKPLPAIIMTELKKNNLARDVNRNPQQARELQKYDSLRIQDNKIIIRSK
jgi:hypothetical protein